MCTASTRSNTAAAAGPKAASSSRPLATRSCSVLADRARLLVDLLEHEVPVLALLGRIGRQLAFLDRSIGAVAFAIDHAHAVAPDLGDVALVEEHEAARHRQQRRDIRGDEILAVAQAQHHRTAHARDDRCARDRLR